MDLLHNLAKTVTIEFELICELMKPYVIKTEDEMQMILNPEQRLRLRMKKHEPKLNH